MQSKEDVLNRESFVKQIVDLTKILSEKRKNCCFAIEGEWGSGKSFVLEKIQECLQVEQSETTNTDRFFVVRYDCWRYDYYEEPIVAIISVLKDKIEQYVSLLSNETKKEMLAIVKNTITKIAVEAIKSKTGVDLDGVVGTSEDDAMMYLAENPTILKKVTGAVESHDETYQKIIAEKKEKSGNENTSSNNETKSPEDDKF